jgi:hypothetical protein
MTAVDTVKRCLDHSCADRTDCARWVYRSVGAGPVSERLRPLGCDPDAPCPNRYPMLSFYARRPLKGT